MSTFTVASGPINFGASGGDEDFFGGSSTPNDQGFTAAAVYAPVPEPSSEFPTTSYASAPWDVSGGYTAEEPAPYPAPHQAAGHDIYQPQGQQQQQQPPSPYSNPLYDATATYQPPQATVTQPWAAPEADAVPEYAYNQPAAAPHSSPPPTHAEDHLSSFNQTEAPQEDPTSQWNTASVLVPSYEDSVAKRELSFVDNIAPPPAQENFQTSGALVADSTQQQPVQQPAPWPMPAANPSIIFTEDEDGEDDDAALFDQIDATFSGNLDTDSLFSSSISTTATAAATAAPGGTAPNSATTTSAAVMPLNKTEPQGYPFSPPVSMASQARTYAGSPIQAAPQTAAQQRSPPPPPPPMSPPRFQPPAAPHPPPPAAPPTYQYASATVPKVAINATNNNNSAAAPTTSTAPPVPTAAAAAGSRPISRVSSLGSSPRTGNVNLEAGRRKLEEYKRRKQAVLGARKTPGVSSPLSGANSGAAVGGNNIKNNNEAVITERFQAELAAALSRATAAEASSAEMSRDLDHVLRQLETVDQERNSLQREKAAMVGEMMAIQAALETAQTQAASYQILENKIQNAEMQIQELEAARNDLISLLEKERIEHRQHLEAVQIEKKSALMQGDESSQRAAQHVEEVQQWIAATQADSQAVREENERLRQELETALAAAAVSASAQSEFSSSSAAAYEMQIQQQQEQNNVLQQEVSNLHVQLESERAQRIELETRLTSSQQEQEQERQMLMDQGAQLQTRIQELEQQLMQQQQYASYSGDGAYSGGVNSFIKQEEEDQQQVYSQQQQYDQQHLQPPSSVAYYEAGAAGEYTIMDASVSHGNNNTEEFEQALARAHAAESDLEALRNELESTKNEAAALRENVSRLQSEAAAMDKLHLDSPSNSRRAVNNDPESLRYRLAKAEAAVEKERRMIQALESQVREGEAAAAEGRASTAAAFELRRRCDAAEREAAAAKAAVEQLQSAASASSGAMADAQVQQMLSKLRLAEEKASSTDAVASDLRSQCDAAAKTIAKLVEENQDLMDRLNRQGNRMAELQESQHQHQQQQVYSPGSPFAGAAAAAARRGEPQYHQQQQQEFNTPTQNTAPPVWNIPGAVPIQPPPQQQQQQGGRYYQREEEIQENENNGGGNGGGGAGRVYQDRDVSPRYSQESSGAGGGRKKKGFWSWLAGEDLVD